MKTKWLPTLSFGLSIAIIGCGDPGTANEDGTGGSESGGSSTGGSATGGTASGGTASGGAQAGGSDGVGGASTGGSNGSGGSDTGGSDGAGGSDTGGSDGAGGSDTGGSDGAGGNGTGGETGGDGDPRPSQGCGMSGGDGTLTAGGSSVSGGLPTSTRLSIMGRDYIIDIPADYDPAHPYRLIFSWHQAYGSANGNAVGQYPANNGPNFDAVHYAYFGLQRAATEANDAAIFVAPEGVGNFPWDYDRDVALFDALLAKVTENLCVDESRVFTTGFSFGAMMSHALSKGRGSKLRGAVTMAAANYNFAQPTSDGTPVAYFGITGMSDGTCPWVNNEGGKTGGKFCVLEHAEQNGCTIPGNIETAMVGSKKYLCHDFEGCDAGYPVKVCTFDGNHTPSVVDDGSNGGDDGRDAFVPPLAWEFISQF